MAERFIESSSRGPKAESLAAACKGFIRQAESAEEKYAHIAAEDKAKVVEECQAAMKWLKEKQALQETLPKHEVSSVPSGLIENPAILYHTLHLRQHAGMH